MKISRQTREIINIVLFFIVAGMLLVTYVIYPLNRTADLYERPDTENYDADSLVINDATAFIKAGLAADTFRVESDGLANLAVVMVAGFHSDWHGAKGTVILLPSENANRDSLIDLATMLVDSGFNVIAMDLRATGRSTGTYKGDGSFEASDLTAVIHYLALREFIVEPLTVVGFSLGADAALLAAHDNEIINRVIAVEPYLTTLRMQDMLKDKFEMYWFPFYRTVMWFWYEIRSGYAPPYRKLEDLKAVPCQTFLFVAKDHQASEEVLKLQELSNSSDLHVEQANQEMKQDIQDILSIICR